MTLEESNRRLLVLADFLEKLPPERFRYDEWVGEDWRGAQDLSCGTTACALGWAATIPEFREQGLVLSSGGVPELSGVTFASWDFAAAKVFGIDFIQARRLFMPDPAGVEDDAPPKYVAAKIRAFIARRGGEPAGYSR